MRLFKRYAPYAERLGKPCWAVRKRDGSKAVKYRVIAVSHKGAICLRRWDDESGKHGWWISYKDVPKRVWWRENDVPMEVR